MTVQENGFRHKPLTLFSSLKSPPTLNCINGNKSESSQAYQNVLSKLQSGSSWVGGYEAGNLVNFPKLELFLFVSFFFFLIERRIVILHKFSIFFLSEACKYDKGEWLPCNEATNEKTRQLTLKKGDPNICNATMTIVKPCRRRNAFTAAKTSRKLIT